MAIPDDVKKEALLAAQGSKDTLKDSKLVEASSADVERGPTTVPGHTSGYGRNHNPPEPTPAPEPAPSPTIEPGG